MIINGRGELTTTEWLIYQVSADVVGSITTVTEGTVTEETFPTIVTEGTGTTGTVSYTVSGRCIGNQQDLAGRFTAMTCNHTIVLDGGVLDYIEQVQCVRTLNFNQ